MWDFYDKLNRSYKQVDEKMTRNEQIMVKSERFIADIRDSCLRAEGIARSM